MTATVPSAANATLDDLITTDEYTIGGIFLLNENGDVPTKWDSRNPDEVAVARTVFDALKAAGHLIYKVTGKGRNQQREIMREFDPRAEKMVAMKRPVGG